MVAQVAPVVTSLPPIYLHLMFAILQFEILSLMNLDFYSISNLSFTGYSGQKNSVQTWKQIQFIKLENCKNPVQIDREFSYQINEQNLLSEKGGKILRNYQ